MGGLSGGAVDVGGVGGSGSRPVEIELDQGQCLGDLLRQVVRGAVDQAQVVVEGREDQLRLRPSATGPDAASTSGPSRTPATTTGVVRLCRCRGRIGCPADRAGPTPAAAPATAPATEAAAARSAPTTHRPRSTVEYPHHHERPNGHTGHGLPGRFSKIVLRVLCGCVRIQRFAARSGRVSGRWFRRLLSAKA